MGRARYAYTRLYYHPESDSLFWGDGTPMGLDADSQLVEDVTDTDWARAEAKARGLVRAGDGKHEPPCCGPGLEGL